MLSPILILLTVSSVFPSLNLFASQCLFFPFLSLTLNSLALSPQLTPHYSHSSQHALLHIARKGVEELAPTPVGRSGRQTEDKTTFPTHWVDQQGLNPGLGTMLGIRQLIIVSTITLTSESDIFRQCLFSLLTASLPSLPLLPLRLFLTLHDIFPFLLSVSTSLSFSVHGLPSTSHLMAPLLFLTFSLSLYFSFPFLCFMPQWSFSQCLCLLFPGSFCALLSASLHLLISFSVTILHLQPHCLPLDL